MYPVLLTQSSVTKPVGSLKWGPTVILTCWWLKCADEVRHFIRMLFWTLQHTIVAVIADGLGPGRKIKESNRGRKRVKGKVQTTVSWPALGPQRPPLHVASAVAATAPAPTLPAHKHYANQWQEFSQTRNRPPKMGKINEFLAFLVLPILHADNVLSSSMVSTIEASRYWAGCHMPLHVMAQHCYSSTHLLLICGQFIPRGATGEQWRDAPPRTFHKTLLSCLMNLYCIRGLRWLLGLHENTISPHHTPSYLICLECVIGCEVERGAVLICANQVCGYGGTGASHPWKVLYLTLCAGVGECTILALWCRAFRAASILLLQPSKLLVW